MAVSIVVIPLIILIGVFCISLPIIIGTYVYRDAKNRGMNATLWTLLSILAPGFIGLIVYLIVRSDNNNLPCIGCGKNVRRDFSVCPYCGTSLKNACSRCGFPLESGWENCPSCGEPIPPERQTAYTTVAKNDKSLRGILAVVILIPIILCILLAVGAAMFVATPSMSGITSKISKSDISSPEILNWLKQNDSAGKNVYVLKYFNKADRKNELLFYFNYPISSDSLYFQNDAKFGMIGKNELQFQLINEDDESPKKYLLVHFDSDASTDYNFNIVDDNGKKIDYVLTDAHDIGIKDGLLDKNVSQLFVSIDFAENLRCIYSVSCDLWSDGKTVSSTGTTSNADGSPMNEWVDFSTELNDSRNITAFSITAFDKNNKPIFESQKYDIDTSQKGADQYFGFTIGYDKNGNIAMVASEE